MKWKNSKTKGVLAISLILICLAGGVHASNIFSVSNTIEDQIDVTPDNTRDRLHIRYKPGNELGRENKKLRAGTWENFGLEILNQSPPKAPPWENIQIRTKLLGVEGKAVSIEYRTNEKWKKVEVKDLRIFNTKKPGAVSDIGPENGWKIPSENKKRILIRIKIDNSIENLDLKMKAISKCKSIETPGENLKPLENKTVLEPKDDTFIREDRESKNFSDEDHLELINRISGNSHILIRWDKDDIPEKTEEASLFIHKYWGYKYSELREEGIKLQCCPISEDWNEETVTWIERPKPAKSPVFEENLHKGEWYELDLTEYFDEYEKKQNGILIKFSESSFDNEQRRIRFDSVNSDIPPFLLLENN